ncbi:hypothetical protein P7C73_g2784, partial [Tremellales sp. Uapishka_1]
MSIVSVLRRELVSADRRGELRGRVAEDWSGTSFVAYGWHSQETNARLSALNALKYSVWVSRGAGLVLAFDGFMILVPVLRNIIKLVRPKLQWLFPADENLWVSGGIVPRTDGGVSPPGGVPDDLLDDGPYHRALHQFHQRMSRLQVRHGETDGRRMKVERTQVRQEAAWQIHYTQAGGITGHTASRRSGIRIIWRRADQEQQAFFFMIGLYTHATGCFVRDSTDPDYIRVFPFYSTDHCLGYESWRFTIWAGIFYFGERVYREIRARRKTDIVKVLQHPSGAMELRFVKPSFKYKAGQWLFINCPEVSRWQWHPVRRLFPGSKRSPAYKVHQFTISSAPEDPFVSVHIRQVGDFTKALGARLGAAGPSQGGKLTGEKGQRRGDFIEISPSSIGQGMPALRIDGPFGAPAEDVFKSEVAVLIGAGIGVTPFASILKHIWYAQRSGKLGALRRVEFIWSCRDTGSFGWFQSLLEEIEEAQTDPDFLRISMDADEVQNIALNDVGQEYDPLTLLRSRTLFGRPDFPTIFKQIAGAIENGTYLPGREATLKTRMGVYFCGPNALAGTIRKAATKHRSSSIEVKFAKEHF